MVTLTLLENLNGCKHWRQVWLDAVFMCCHTALTKKTIGFFKKVSKFAFVKMYYTANHVKCLTSRNLCIRNIRRKNYN